MTIHVNHSPQFVFQSRVIAIYTNEDQLHPKCARWVTDQRTPLIPFKGLLDDALSLVTLKSTEVDCYQRMPAIRLFMHVDVPLAPPTPLEHVTFLFSGYLRNNRCTMDACRWLPAGKDQLALLSQIT
ncbi:hypothetical protein CDAR_168121 [Caerostris darwini]|uniref:Uncharacterized protein n=1 Tax=Caerostris darwini TaxID=1538125 RepID=A0AAV4VL15_9ARAC|nr:hypothetical protein CDAR_168121 [Caerostris darwini]